MLTFLIEKFALFCSPVNSTFWVGVYRPYQNEDKWLFAYRSPCNQMPSRRIKNTVPCDHQCLTLTFVDNEGQRVEGTANCAQKLPYTCAADPGLYLSGCSSGFTLR